MDIIVFHALFSVINLIASGTSPLSETSIMANNEDETSQIKFQNLMQSIPVCDRSQKQSIQDFFNNVENVAESGPWTDEQKVRVAQSRITGIAAKFATSELIKAILN